MTSENPIILAATRDQAIEAAVAAGHNPHACTLFATDESRQSIGVPLAADARPDGVTRVDGWENGRHAQRIASKLRGRGLIGHG